MNKRRSCTIGYDVQAKAIAPIGWAADIVPQPAAGKVFLHVFLDRSVVETYTGGAVATTRCFLPPKTKGSDVLGIDLWAKGGTCSDQD